MLSHQEDYLAELATFKEKEINKGEKLEHKKIEKRKNLTSKVSILWKHTFDFPWKKDPQL